MPLADLLLEEDDEVRQQRKRKDSTNFGCFWPRSVLSRCFWWIKNSSKGKRIVAGSKNVERETRREKVLDGCSVNGLNGESSSSEVAGRYRMEASFNLGIGFGLVYLSTTIKNELSKMTELRTQMEMLLHNVKETLQSQKRETLTEKYEFNANLACATGDTQVGVDNLSFVENIADSENVFVFAQPFNCNTTRQEKCAEEMDQLEAELEAELERLQIHLDSESTSTHPEERRIEMKIEGTAPGGSLSASFGEVIDRPDSGSNGHGRVSPNELQIRLHELLEARQEQRIKELQANLEQAKRKIFEKEKEVSWWKDTAQAVYPHLSKTPHLSR